MASNTLSWPEGGFGIEGEVFTSTAYTFWRLPRGVHIIWGMLNNDVYTMWVARHDPNRARYRPKYIDCPDIITALAVINHMINEIDKGTYDVHASRA